MQPAAPRVVTLIGRLRGLLWYILSLLAFLSPLLLIIMVVVLFSGVLEIR